MCDLLLLPFYLYSVICLQATFENVVILCYSNAFISYQNRRLGSGKTAGRRRSDNCDNASTPSCNRATPTIIRSHNGHVEIDACVALTFSGRYELSG